MAINEAQTMGNDLPVKHVPSFNPLSIKKIETESNVTYVIYFIKITVFRIVRSKG